MSFNSSAGLPPIHAAERVMPIPLAPHHLQNLANIVRQANHFYRMVAAAYRAARKPTYHARKLAAQMNLRVDTYKAFRCPMNKISNVAYPLIDMSLGPHTPPARSVVQDLYEVEAAAPVIPFDIPGVCRANVPLKHKPSKLPTIIIPAIGSERRQLPKALRAIAPHEQVTEMYTSPTQPSSYFSAVTPDIRETPVFNVHVWDSNMSLQHTERVVPDDVAASDVEMDLADIVLTPMSTEAEDGSYFEDEEEDEDRFRYVVGGTGRPEPEELCYPEFDEDESPSSSDASGSNSTSPSSLSSISTPSEGSPMAICNNPELDYYDEDCTRDFGLDRKPPKYLRKELAIAQPVPRYRV
ncbi:hypothetical protein PQX77_005580 [Marasmius sp. AFHP31]|nr:hypothetical protein PQX77_005580 [Marasmius sp. AFHP31]